VVSTGDDGAEGCDNPSESSATGPISVNVLASSPYTVAVGGTQFNENENNSTYRNPSNGLVVASAKSYIPEDVWNESLHSRRMARSGRNRSCMRVLLWLAVAQPAWTPAPLDHSARARCLGHDCDGGGLRRRHERTPTTASQSRHTRRQLHGSDGNRHDQRCHAVDQQLECERPVAVPVTVSMARHKPNGRAGRARHPPLELARHAVAKKSFRTREGSSTMPCLGFGLVLPCPACAAIHFGWYERLARLLTRR
jgi:hypothetical protein